MKTAVNFGDNSQAKEPANNMPVAFVVQRMAQGLKKALGGAGVCGAVISCGDNAQYQRYIAQALGQLPAAETALRISCSKFSQKLGLGALLFLVAGSSVTDLANDNEVFHALKRRFMKIGLPVPLTVIVEHADLLDVRSERVLCRLVAAGTIQLLLLTHRSAELGEIFTALSTQQKLPVFNEYVICREEFLEFLHSRLGAQISAEASSHYWSHTGGLLPALTKLVQRDLTEQRLVLLGESWELVTTPAEADEQRSHSSTGLGQLSSAECEMLNRFANRRFLPASEFSGEQKTPGILERLFGLGLIENLAAGRVGLSLNSAQHPITGQLPTLESAEDSLSLDCPVSFEIERIGNGFHREAIASIKRHHYGSGHQCDLDNCRTIRGLALYSSWLALDDVSGAQEILNISQDPKVAFTITGDLSPAELDVQQWYLDIRRGRQPQIGFADDSTEGILACIYDARWHDEATRIIGILCVAYSWMNQGKLTGSSRLLRWALESFEKSESFLRDECATLWLPHTVFLLSFLSYSLQDWRSLRHVEELLARAERPDATAGHYAKFFRVLGKMARGSVKEAATEYSELVFSEEHVVPEQMGYSSVGLQGLLTSLAAEGQHNPGLIESVEKDFDFNLEEQWNGTYLHQMHRAFTNADESLTLELNEQFEQLMIRGAIFSALQVVALTVSLGNVVQREQMQQLVSKVATDYILEIQQLNNALWAKDEKSIVELSCALASRGLHFHAALPLRRIDKGKTVFRRQLQRSLMKLANSVAGLSSIRPDEPANAPTQEARTGWCAPLTSRERSVAVMAARGLRNAELAEHFGISVRTIEGHLYQVQVKLNLRNRRELRDLVNNEPRGTTK